MWGTEDLPILESMGARQTLGISRAYGIRATIKVLLLRRIHYHFNALIASNSTVGINASPTTYTGRQCQRQIQGYVGKARKMSSLTPTS